MKIILCLAALVLLVSLVQAYPEPLSAEVKDTFMEAESRVRQKRASCDLLSGFGVNHSVCAAHCIARGRMGGYCNGQAVCVCR